MNDKYGKGRVTSVKGNTMHVEYKDREAKYIMPNCFTSQTLHVLQDK